MRKTVTSPGQPPTECRRLRIKSRFVPPPERCHRWRSAKLRSTAYVPWRRWRCGGGAPADSDTLAKPTCQAAVWLITQPEPSELDERLARPRIAGPAYPAIAIHPTALERCWGKAEI